MPLPKLTPTSKKRIIYTDFRKDLLMNPISSDLAVLKNEDAINDSLRNLVMTDRGERLMQPLLGCDIRASLFGLMTPVELKLAEEKVRETINNHEPRVKLIDVGIVGLYDRNAVIITITYYAINSQEPVTVEFLLENVR